MSKKWIRLQRFWKDEMKGWPKLDADLILYFEIVLMGLFLTMNSADLAIQTYFPEAPHYMQAGAFPVSQFLLPFLEGNELVFDSRRKNSLVDAYHWDFYIPQLFVLLQTLTHLVGFSQHLFFQSKPQGQFGNNPNVTSEVQLMMDPNADPYAAGDESAEVENLVHQMMDLNRIQLLNAYTAQNVVDVPANAQPTKQEKTIPKKSDDGYP